MDFIVWINNWEFVVFDISIVLFVKFILVFCIFGVCFKVVFIFLM